MVLSWCSVSEVQVAHASGFVVACKLYPQGATTNSAQGVVLTQSDSEASTASHPLACLDPVLAAMTALGMPLLVHGEVADAEVDIFDRERVFISTVLAPLRLHHPALKASQLPLLIVLL